MKSPIAILTALISFLLASITFAADVPPKDDARGTTLYLLTQQCTEEAKGVPPFARELFRQSLLIAARDNMGLQTRDQSLREWPTAFIPDHPIGMVSAFGKVSIYRGNNDQDELWNWDIPQKPRWPYQTTPCIDLAESLSNTDFVTTLQGLGYKAAPNTWKDDAPAPDNAESRLADLDPLTQFALLRQTHDLIRTSGESPARLSVLIRAYANLGQLTRFHWSVEHDVYETRSLLYAARLMAKQPDSQFSYWNRAYARSLCGFLGDAINDFNDAEKKGNAQPPAWYTLLEPYCKYDAKKLQQIAAADKSQAPMALYFAFLTLEQSKCQSAIMKAAQQAFDANPHCMRLVDAMCDYTGPGMLNQLTETGPQSFSTMLGDEFPKIPGLPQNLLDQFTQLRRPGGNPTGRETICQALLTESAPGKDKTEPSWAALGRLIQETTFAQTRRRADLICNGWGADAGDYAKQVHPLIAEHRFSPLIEAYGAFRNSPAATNAALKKMPLGDLNFTERPYYDFVRDYNLADNEKLDSIWHEMGSGADSSAFSLDGVIGDHASEISTGTMDQHLNALSWEGPDSPWLIVAKLLHDNFDENLAKQWEADHGDLPTVAMALGKKYSELKRWPDAERCFKKYIQQSPDLTGYHALAQFYLDSSQPDKWLATLKDFINHTEDYGLQHAQVQIEIANHFMTLNQYPQAIPYADQAAQTGAEWAMISDARAHTGINDFNTAEQLLRQAADAYGQSPYTWFAWTLQTGHGDHAAALTALKTYFQSHAGRLSNEDMIELACFDELQHKPDKAIPILQQRFKLVAGPNSLAHIMIDADQLNDPKTRDDAAAQIKDLKDQDSPFVQFDMQLKNAYDNPADQALDLKTVDALIEAAEPGTKKSLCYLAASYLATHNHADLAMVYYKKSQTKNEAMEIYTIEQSNIDQALRDNGIDPWTLTPTTTQPTK